MRRYTQTPRQGWQRIVEEQGLPYHTPEGKVYWNEGARYEFTMSEVLSIERATEELYEMYLAAAQRAIDERKLTELGIPQKFHTALEETWNSEPPSLYGRFDLAFNGEEPPKLLEFNADTPTALVEAAIIQWYWKENCFPKADQFNSLHEKLVAKWHDLKPSLGKNLVHFCHLDNWEDWMTCAYLRDTAAEAGIPSAGLLMEEIGWQNGGHLVGIEEEEMTTVFKLYPWEWLLQEIPQGGEGVITSVQWIEPLWRLMWSSKGMLSLLWEMYPNHPNLLPAFRDNPRGMERYARKPVLSREGANVTIYDEVRLFETPGPYGNDGWIYQALAPIPNLDGNYPVLGSWYITDQGAAGMGIRESSTMVTDNVSRFVPHCIVG